MFISDVFISGGQPSPLELAFGVELGPTHNSKMVSESILGLFVVVGPIVPPIIGPLSDHPLFSLHARDVQSST